MSKYEIDKKLGEGAFGTVHLYRRRDTNQLMAQKEIKLAALTKNEISRLLDEVKVLEKFRDSPHRNLVEGKGYMHVDDTLCIYMEFCERGPLDKDIKSRQEQNRFYDEMTVLDYTQQIAAGLDHMHRHLVIHRDLKPANILVTRDGVIKLADFGLGALLNSEFSMRATAVGTPLYMAPEIFKDEEYKFSCDIWAFGSIVYELMALQPAFMARSLPAVMTKVLAGNFNPLDNSYSEPIKGLVKLMLVVDPNKRPDSSSIAALKFLSDRKVDASSMGEIETLLSKKAKERERKEEEEKLEQQREIEEKKRIQEEECKRREEVEQQRRKEDELRRREEEVAEKLRQLHVREAEENKRKQEEERTRLEVERQWREDSERKRQEEIERKWQEEVLRMRQEEIERQRNEEVERKRREEVLRMRQEEIERQRVEEIERQRVEEVERKQREEVLQMRMQMRQLAVTKVMLDNGADMNAKSSDDVTPLKLATDKGHAAVAALLMTRQEEEEEEERKIQGALAFFQQNGRADVAKILLDNNGDINAEDSNGKAPLHLASKMGHVDAVKVLLDRGANVNAKASYSNGEYTPLHFASYHGNVHVVKVLMDRGAQIDAKTTDGRLPGYTPLHFASRYGRMDMVKVLLDKGASINARTTDNKSPLKVATDRGKTAVADYLRSCGETAGKTQKDAAFHDEIERLLLIKY